MHREPTMIVIPATVISRIPLGSPVFAPVHRVSTSRRAGCCEPDPLVDSPEPIGSVRNLLYYICPISNNGVWQSNVRQLLRHIDLFNGKRIIAIATGGLHRPRMRMIGLDAPEAVQEAFAGHDCEFLTFRNDRVWGESVAWPTLWSKVLPGEPQEVTFYAHAKGVSRPQHQTVHRWAMMMYEVLLSDWPTVQESLTRYSVVCAFKKLGYGFDGVPSTWHPTGTFAWVRNADLAARPWHDDFQRAISITSRQNPPRQAWCTESVWGMTFSPDEAVGLLLEAFATTMPMYDPGHWLSTIEPAWEAWKACRNGVAVLQ